MDIYPYIKTQEDLVAVVESEYKITTGDSIPPLFLNRLLKYRRDTILEAMKEEKVIKFDKLGKLKIANSTRDKNEVLKELGDDYTPKKFKEKLNDKYQKGELHSQRFTKSMNKPKCSKGFSFNVVSKGKNK